MHYHSKYKWETLVLLLPCCWIVTQQFKLTTDHGFFNRWLDDFVCCTYIAIDLIPLIRRKFVLIKKICIVLHNISFPPAYCSSVVTLFVFFLTADYSRNRNRSCLQPWQKPQNVERTKWQNRLSCKPCTKITILLSSASLFCLRFRGVEMQFHVKRI